MNLTFSWNALDVVGRFCVLLMILSGLLHIPFFWIFDAPWESRVSFRKPILFGLSTGITLWSLLDAIQRMRPWPIDRILARSTSLILLLEVALITLQAWRGRASHFNRLTTWDTVIESLMWWSIVFASFVVFLLTIRAWQANVWSGDAPAMRLAIRWGLMFLAISCALGFTITNLGFMNLTLGRPPEVWPPKGILKFPHGAVLHAIQLLVILAWICDRFHARWPLWAIGTAVAANGTWLAFASMQTIRGKGRWELDPWSTAILVVTVALTVGSLFLATYAQPRSSPIWRDDPEESGSRDMHRDTH
jgi:hypothetical protein